jgi:hypothetical protein
MVFRKRGPLRADEVWYYGNAHVDTVNDFNYLGTVFNYTGSFVLNQEFLAGKGLKALNSLIMNTRDLKLKPSTMLQLFDSFVGSTLNYACEVWGNSKSKSLESIHLKFCKTLLRVKRSTPSMAVYGDLGRYPLYINRYVRIIGYWLKLVNTDNILLEKMYSLLLTDNKQGHKNWVTGLNNFWTNMDSVMYGLTRLQLIKTIFAKFLKEEL